MSGVFTEPKCEPIFIFMSSLPDPQQDRSRLTRTRLIEALMALLETHEFRDIGVQDIAERAGTSVGTVYRHFANKEDFLNTLLKMRIDRIEARLSIETAPIPPDWSLEKILAIALQQSLTQVEADAPILRTLLTHRPIQPELNKTMEELQSQALRRMELFLDRCGSRVTHPDKDSAAAHLFHVLNTIFLDRVIATDSPAYWAKAPDRETLIAETCKMMLAYLTPSEIG